MEEELKALGIFGGLKADCVRKSKEVSGLSEREWVAALIKDLMAWRAGTKRVKFVEYALAFVDS